MTTNQQIFFKILGLIVMGFGIYALKTKKARIQFGGYVTGKKAVIVGVIITVAGLIIFLYSFGLF